MTTDLKKLENMVSQAVADGKQTGPQIRGLIDALRGFHPDVTDEDAEKLAKDIEKKIGVSMGLGAVVDDKGEFRPWLDDAKADGTYDPYYWPRYAWLLARQGLPPDVIRTTDEVTDRLLARLGSPHNEADWDRRGMVVGHVQSGKTANYAGLVCKAADAGYRFIVVIAGIHNNLRDQTQERIDEGFIGRDTGRRARNGKGPKVIGVGLHDSSRTPVSLTTTVKDFDKATATTNTSSPESFRYPLVLVIKKNYRTLDNLVQWLRENNPASGAETVSSFPMLLIDDEADNASINTKYGKGEATRINGQIRDLLNLFQRSCYVGYTATPFANVFIDPDDETEGFGEDLFPRNFIIGLDAPTNYFGARKVFVDGMPEDEEPEFLRFIDDNGDILPLKHKKDDPLDALPDSLVYALRTFVVARAVRNVRGQSDKHATMLVNASRFTDMQGRLKNLLQDRLDTIREAVQVDGARGTAALRNAEIAILRDIWAEEYGDAGETWPQVQAELHDFLATAKVVQVNSKENGLDYDEAGDRGVTVVAVGGFSLSRGLTLEGLTVSYFLRNSKMYDTLMQMGRWFGYRIGYEDLCRVWMPREAADWYSHIAVASDELHGELRRMQKAGATPQQFGLAVRSHPTALMVTARNKIGTGQETTMKIGLSNAFVETTRLDADPTVLETNREAARHLVDRIAAERHPVRDGRRTTGGFLVKEISVDVIDEFLLAFENADENILTEKGPLRRYIRERCADELALWDILVTSARDSDEAAREVLPGLPFGYLKRGIGDGGATSRGVIAVGGSKMRVASRGIERAGLREEEALKAEADYRQSEGRGKSERINYPDRIYRAARARPLLILSLLDIQEPTKDVSPDFTPDRIPSKPVIAWGISFPESKYPESRVEYVVNKLRWNEMYGDEDEEEDEGMIDDD